MSHSVKAYLHETNFRFLYRFRLKCSINNVKRLENSVSIFLNSFLIIFIKWNITFSEILPFWKNFYIIVYFLTFFFNNPKN